MGEEYKIFPISVECTGLDGKRLETRILISNLYEKEIPKIRIAISNIKEEIYQLGPKPIKIERSPRDRHNPYYN